MVLRSMLSIITKEGIDKKEVRKYNDYHIFEEGILLWRIIICVLDQRDLRRLVFHEAHDAPYFGKPTYQKTYQGMKQLY
jgi:hypothetical protein